MPLANTGPAFSGVNKRLETSTSTEGTVNVTATSILVVAANNDRAVLYVTNLGSEWVTVNHKATPTYGQGIMLSPNGGTYMIESGNLDKRLLHAITATGKTSTLSFYEGTGEEVSQT